VEAEEEYGGSGCELGEREREIGAEVVVGVDAGDANECHSIGNTQAPVVATAPFGCRWQQRDHALPQIVRNKISTHSDTLPTGTVYGKTRSSTWRPESVWS